ncbi:MAG: cyanophycinase [Acidibacillus sp.]|uniref:Cyanophycinase n=1 Tax=Sulfoacidibacillus ferrooxidans TaxID=2005001 RepID=A0A9X1V7D9_9BACL|nr:cyanophycinase [Sulfoacidibacillus ferrooxidans]MCI0182624.1 Cyanophycinase [Sulfoacidibacillus ferrooxidans]MCY0894104.1 cyanophycinase [Acidibacillus sp.]
MSEQRGALVIIGGAEDKRGNMTILREFVRLAGGTHARIVVMTVATELPLEVGADYIDVFEKIGVEDVRTFDVSAREAADRDSACRAIEKATGVFFTGGEQLRITTLLGGTQVDSALHTAHERGVVLAGTSAGASMMSSTMIVEGVGDTNPRVGIVHMAPGMEFIDGIVIDQHFAQRGRLGRLLSAVAQYPHHLGLGIDEDTAVIVRNTEFEVIGRGAVSVVDAGSLTFSNLGDLQNNDALALCGVKLHILPAGYQFSLRERKPNLERLTRSGNE